ncbi:MAG: hypothetical protein R2867_19390, partial [Caldilineaceae bacterium]
LSAILVLAVAHWVLIGLATLGRFGLWPIVLPVVAFAIVLGLLCYLRLRRVDRIVTVGLVLLGALLYSPPAEELFLSGDAAIYVNEAIFVARTGGLSTTHEALAAIPPESRTLFYLTSQEQYAINSVHAYAGMVYRGYYMIDPATATIQISRMPLSTVWLALVYALAGLQTALYSTPLFAILGVLLLYAVGRRLFGWPVALCCALLLAVSFMQIHFGRTSYAEIYGQFWTLAGMFAALAWMERRHPALLATAIGCWVTTWAGRVDALLLLPAIGLLLIYAGLDQDRRTLRLVALLTPLFALLIYLSTNRAYVGATFELLAMQRPWFYGALFALVALLPLGTGIAWLWGGPIQRLLQRVAPLLHVVLFLLTAFVILWATVPNPLRDPTITRKFQEIIWFSSAYITPLLYWLALIGIGRLLFGRAGGAYDRRSFWLLATFYTLAVIFF